MTVLLTRTKTQFYTKKKKKENRQNQNLNFFDSFAALPPLVFGSGLPLRF